MTLPGTADVVIAGAGIVGCATAHALSKRGLSVVVLEKGDVGGAVTGASLACIGTHMIDTEEIPYLRSACTLWEHLVDELDRDFEYQRCGQLRFIAREDGLAVAREWVEAERTHGLQVELLDPKAVHEIVPALTSPIVGATWSPGDATVNPFLSCRALIEAAVQHGTVILPRSPVTAIEIEAGAIRAVRSGSHCVATCCFINATGPWARQVAAMAQVDIPIQPRKAQCLATVRLDPVIPCVVGACESAGGVGAGYTQIQQAHSGQVLFNTVLAGGLREDGDQDRDLNVDYPFILDSIQTLLWLFPSLSDAPLLRSWARYEAVTPDNRFLVGQVSSVRGFFMAAGDCGIGFVLAPLIAEALAQIIFEGDYSPEIKLYDPTRFDVGSSPMGHI
jgi:glycine/D-amino acid oxidase-like deaminating enzyme